ncbi:hypothetical protein BBI01_06705 [Chryseobacterium artocarpi]|uniref:Iron dicitrate transport regulator FecR n=1 Tax=Chryseobacterium artocarpi TaxID=1414727 RepID=A0A1B8ZXP7_9FLAO|nr:FecR family protein [Chryseobacterium artocarpi]OCA76377.1 hypothetical protein BBI01_06705 [Chryseobacterium artocarpi]
MIEYNQEYDAVKLGELAAKRLRNELSEKDEELLNHILDRQPELRNAYQFLTSDNEDFQFKETKIYDSKTALERVLLRYNRPRKKKKRAIWYAAASLIVFLSLGAYWIISIQHLSDKENLVSRYGNDIIAGTVKPKIILSNGSSYELDTAQGGIQVQENRIQYENGNRIVSGNELVNITLVTPKGRQYRITLPDGTKAVLNAATSLTYPTRFTGKQRLVKLDGEAYFEVTPDPRQPFHVKSNNQEIVVLGTKFNASSYPAEKTVTTLIEGKIHLSAENTKDILLAPGQQAELGKENFKVQEVHTEDYTSWMNNEFIFNNMPLDEVFAVLEKWYDVSFDYPQELIGQRIYVEMTRKRKLSEVLTILEEVTSLKFKIEGRRIIIRK